MGDRPLKAKHSKTHGVILPCTALGAKEREEKRYLIGEFL
jgi:hypothetical protein